MRQTMPNKRCWLGNGPWPAFLWNRVEQGGRVWCTKMDRVTCPLSHGGDNAQHDKWSNATPRVALHTTLPPSLAGGYGCAAPFPLREAPNLVTTSSRPLTNLVTTSSSRTFTCGFASLTPRHDLFGISSSAPRAISRSTQQARPCCQAIGAAMQAHDLHQTHVVWHGR